MSTLNFILLISLVSFIKLFLKSPIVSLAVIAAAMTENA